MGDHPLLWLLFAGLGGLGLGMGLVLGAVIARGLRRYMGNGDGSR